jgi:predicted RecB family nuclease
MVERLITPSKITAWLECAHFLSLRNQADAGALQVEPRPMGSLADLLIEKGAAHERNCLLDLENEGRSVYQVPGRNAHETFVQWVKRIGDPMEHGYEVIYQMPFAHEGIRGIADFLVRVQNPENGYCQYEPVDAKLTRVEGKPGHVLQLCFYADALEALTGSPPREMHLWLGSGDQESLRVEEFRPYWRRLRRQLADLLNEDMIEGTTPEPCDHCDYCEFSPICDARWRREDSLVYVANIRRPERRALESVGVRTIVALSSRVEPVAAIHEKNLDRLSRQASLQVASRVAPSKPPVFELVAASDDPVFGHGLDLLPAPDDGDIFFDFEGHPFWTAQHDLFFLAGLYYRDGDGEWSYDQRWAHDLDEQAVMIKELVEFFAARRVAYPSMHVYHYNHTEKSSMERLTRGTESESHFTSLVETGLFVDLYVISKNSFQVGTESYGLKALEHLTGFERRGGIEQGAGAVVEYDLYMSTKDPALLEAIARYNEDDVASTMALRDWIVDQRPDETTWREAFLDEPERSMDTDELVEALTSFGDDSPEHLLGDLLNYWRRERTANTEPKFAQAASEFATLYRDPDFIANLHLREFAEVLSRGALVKNAVFTWPAQPVNTAFADKKKSRVLFTGVGVERGYAYLPYVDLEQRELRMRWKDGFDEAGVVPSVVTIDDYIGPMEKPGVLFHLAEQLVRPDEADPPSRVSMALLGREAPSFEDGFGPVDGKFSDDLAATLSWVGHLDHSYVAVQGPPGTGKTYSGSHIIYELIKSGQRVGITAMSHAAIDNLFLAAYNVFAEKGELDLLRAHRHADKPKTGALEGVKYSSAGPAAENELFNLVAGTTWLWARPGMRPHPVDVLIVDEAGQLALADAIASANAARNLILLGDPLQLSQVSQAEHPGGSGASVLEHILGEHATLPESEGVFIAETRRMHPDVCRFISNQIYEGRLTSHESCAQQATAFGTGLRWLRARHLERSTESEEESEIVVDTIKEMIGTTWVNQYGESLALRAEDFMVVAPYNDQVRLLRRNFDREPGLAHVQVGTVDKFQGREAPVVFFTMTTSSSEDMARGPEFLFSRNRLNVAVSRARCLAFLVCTEELLNSRARTIEEMRLIGTLSAFVEYATAT